MNPLIGESLITGGGSLLGSLLGFGSQERTNKANMQLAEYQYSKALEMWNRQNEYNLPKNQISRLTDAGLNPNLVYGNGTVQGLTSAPAPQYRAPNLQAYTNFGSLGVEQAVTTYMQMKQTDANVNKTNAETNRILKEMPLIDLDKALKELEITKRGLLNSITEKERDHWEEQYNMLLDEMQSRIDKNRSEVPLNLAKEENLKSDTDLNKAKQKTEEERPEYIRAQTRTEKHKQTNLDSSTSLNNAKAEGQRIENKHKDQMQRSIINWYLSETGLNEINQDKAAQDILLAVQKYQGQMLENELKRILKDYGVDPHNHTQLGSLLNMLNAMARDINNRKKKK